MITTRRLSRGLAVAVLLIHAADAWANEIQRPEPGKKIKVFLCAGQSNMEGRADGAKLTRSDRARLEGVQSRVRLAFNREPVRALEVVRPSKDIARLYQRDLIFGPELFFGVSVAESWPDERILIIKFAAGGTSLHGCWNPDWRVDRAALLGEETRPKLYEEFVSYVHEVLSVFEHDEYKVCAMLWVQGETDSTNPVAAEAYGDNLQRLIRRIRQDLHHDTLPFVLFEVGKGRVVEGMRSTAGRLSGVTLIPRSSDPASPDFYATMENGHYNYQGMKKLGHRFADALLSQLKE